MSHAPKPAVANYREFKDYPKIVAAVSRILARKRFVAPVELFVEMGLLLPPISNAGNAARFPASNV